MTNASSTARGAAVGLALSLVLAGCGSAAGRSGTAASAPAATAATSAGAEATTAAEFPVTVASGQLGSTTDLVIEARPESIISLSPSATEALFAVGAGDQVVAVDEFSYYPEEAPVTDLSGFEPNLEAILGYEPDLVIAQGDPGDLVGGLDAAGVPTLLLPAALDLDEAYDQVERIGAATGNLEQAQAVAEQMQADVEAAVASVEDLDLAGTTYYHELDPTFFTAGGDTFIGEVYGLFGLENIADATGEDYPQLSQEFIVEADPDVIFVTSGDFSDTPETIAARPGWAGITAVANEDVVVVDSDTSSRWGPRLVDFVETVATALPEVGDQG